ncbi:hypothetical protein B9N43_01200 [Denitratisoma sp. DHT3]|uniref:sodium:calcium antiporter n=1 Tax=Denitratisoma sp. DHT3 TaxID=1981880 RepID=UPI0011986A29|nr:sodium:calcium antiporter [Denitratisoma sp. DHT3]QDX79991.1 hypothetical protein B9N43_01200 [Denitratisoma sp. DHT3]
MFAIPVINDLALVVAAIVAAGVGGELFLKGVVGVADALRVPKLLVATTLGACATSTPELIVSTTAALAGEPAIGLGDALGSNVINIALVLGLALLSGPIRVARRELGRDFTVALAVPLLTFMLVLDGTLSRADGGLLLGIFCVWLAVSFYSGFRAQGLADHGSCNYRLSTVVLLASGGLIALVLAARLFVAGATGIATAMGVDTYVIGAMVVAVGTSLPELVTVVVSRKRGHDDVGIGTLLGSNLFNGLAIVGIAATIQPMPVPVAEISVALVIGVVVLLMMMPDRIGLLGRIRGVELLLVYLIFVLATLAASGYSGP